MSDDWRLTNQETYLKGVTLYKRRYARYSDEWDHDHCAFCRAKFAEKDVLPEALHEGYTTRDGYHWICESCYRDFNSMFHWTVEE